MSIRIKAGEKVISFTGNNAVLCELRSGWDLDFMDLEDGWMHQLDSEKDRIYYLRVNDSGKDLKVLYFEALSWENGSYETFCLDPVVIWLANDHYYEGNIFLNSYPFIDEDEEHDQDNHNNIDDDKDQDDYSIHKLEHNLIDLYRQYEELMSNSPKGYDRSHEREVNRLEERMSDLEEELFRPHSKK